MSFWSGLYVSVWLGLYVSVWGSVYIVFVGLTSFVSSDCLGPRFGGWEELELVLWVADVAIFNLFGVGWAFSTPARVV